MRKIPDTVPVNKHKNRRPKGSPPPPAHGTMPYNLYNRKHPPGKRVDVALTEVPPRAVDLTGYTNGRLVVTGIAGITYYASGSQVLRWHAACKCGNSVVINGNHFTLQDAKSCGCLNKDMRAEHFRYHSPTRKRKELPEGIRFNPSDLVGYRHAYPKLVGKTYGALAVVALTHVMLYYMLKPRKPSAITGRIPREGRHRVMVSYFDCRCTCGNSVNRNSAYLRKRWVTGSGSTRPLMHACATCTRRRNAVPWSSKTPEELQAALHPPEPLPSEPTPA